MLLQNHRLGVSLPSCLLQINDRTARNDALQLDLQRESNMAIPIRVRECFDAFFVGFEGAEEDEASCLEDELGRFKVWVGNIAAHRPAHSRRSLEYRLRDSSRLREMVVSLLQDLVVAIQDVRKQLLARNSLTANEKPSEEATARTTREQAELRPSDPEYEDADMFELSDEESIDEESPVRQALSEVHDVITCLLRFSMTLRIPSRDDQRRNDRGDVAEAFVAHDTEHVRAKFPEAPGYLIRRLGKALSKHRQYFRYRREHHQKLHDGLDEDDPGAYELLSTVATSLPNDTANVQNLGTDSETESAYTATSFAGTSKGNAVMRVPPWPARAQTGSPFECPICFGIIVADTEMSWRQHVFEDLPPYVCVSETCDSAVKSFSRRREWARHNDTMHDKTWVCPYACGKSVNSPAELRSHVAAEHRHSVLPHGLQKATITSGRTVEVSTSASCPLCTRHCKPGKPWTKHVGHHLEQLALFSLPMELFATDTPDGSDAEQNDDDGHSSALASGSEHPEDNDHLPEDQIVDVDAVRGSALPVLDAPNLVTWSWLIPSELDPATDELSAEGDNQDNLRSAADTSESKIVENDATAEEEIEKLREMIKSQEIELIASKAAIAAHEAQKLRTEQEQEAAAKNEPIPDMEKAPIKFKDAVGRKFSFPWHLCKTWKGMEGLIKQAFLHVDTIGGHVQEGHYDLVGPDDEVILPQAWETLIKPDMIVSMHMWPIPENTQNFRQEPSPGVEGVQPGDHETATTGRNP